jgi:IS5 family transposase
VGVQGSSDSNRELLDAQALVGHLVPAGSVYAFLADHRGELFPDELFADLFASGRGRPSVPADVIATTMVLQSLEGLSDRDAIAALRTDLRWKVAAGLALDDEGFHPTVLTYWRNRLNASERPKRIFEAVRDVVDATGVLKGKTRRALDSTLLDDAVATQDTITQLVSLIRRVRRVVPAASAAVLVGDDYDQVSGKPACAWDDPDARTALVTRLVNDALAVLVVVDGIDLDDAQADLVGLLALVAGQDVEPGDSDGTWRIARRVSEHRVISTVDPETRHMHKNRCTYRDGYKAHLAAEPTTGLITDCRLTPANAPDGATGIDLLAGETEAVEVYADSAYGTGEMLAALDDCGHRPVIKPWPLRRNPNLGDDQFGRDEFIVDYTARTVTCPNGITVTIGDGGVAQFKQRCCGCPLRSRCTSARAGRAFTVGDHDQLLAANRRRWATDADLVADYRTHRPLIERTIAWLTRHGHRRVRYRGVERNQLGLSTRAAAINLRRLVNLGLTHTDSGWKLAT